MSRRRRARRAVVRGVVTGQFLAALLVVAGAVLLVGFLGGSQYQVRTVVVRGNQLAFAEEVARESGVLGRSVFLIDTQDVARRIVSHPAIARATVRAFYPDTVVIDVVERVPASVWANESGTWLVDGEGRVIGTGDLPGLPHVRVASSLSLVPGQRVPPSVAAALAEVTRRYAGRLGGLAYRPGDGLVLVFVGGERILLGDAERLAEQLAVLDALLAEGRGFLHLDLRDPDRPVLWQIAP